LKVIYLRLRKIVVQRVTSQDWSGQWYWLQLVDHYILGALRDMALISANYALLLRHLPLWCRFFDFTLLVVLMRNSTDISESENYVYINMIK